MAVELRTSVPDVNNDGIIDQQEFQRFIDDAANAAKYKDTTFKLGDKTYTWEQLKAKKAEIVAKMGEPKVPEKMTKEAVSELKAKISTFDRAIDDLKKQKGNLEAKLKEAKKGDEAKVRADLDNVNKKLKQHVETQQKNIKQYEAQAARDGQKSELTKKVYQNAEMTLPQHLQGKGQKTGATATVPGAKAQTMGQAGTPKSGQATTPGAKAQTGGWGTLPANWGAMTMTGPKLNTAAYAQSLFMEDQVMGAWDSIFSNKNRGQKLMEVLFYYMRMAMSGDLTAMYNMMKAVLYIISKDKALQQVNMANKLIELQDASRRATDKLLNFNSDPNDPSSQTEFTKLLQSSKAESDSIATSQKLIAQMMEEMAQIVETLTNVTKGALDAAGRVLRTVSRFT